MRMHGFASRGVLVLTLAVLGLQWPVGASADPIQFLFTPYHMRDSVSANSIGRTPGDRLLFGVEVQPNPRCCGDSGTTATASQGGRTVELTYLDSPAAPDEFSGTVLYDPALTGAWTMTVTNPGSANSPAVLESHTVGDVAQVPFVQSMTLTGLATTPTFSWTVPGGFVPDRVSIQIWNLDDRIASGLARLVHRTSLPANATSYTVTGPLNSSGDVLESGTGYAVAILLQDDRSPGSTLSRSVSFFDFTPTDAGSIPIVLPTLDGRTGVYNFNTTVEAGQTVFIDPLVAIGYEYAIGPGNPKFESVMLPEVGDNQYLLYVFRGNRFHFARRLAAGVTHRFPPGGVERFLVLGIEADAGLDPANATAFVTGVAFVESGEFTGTMTPVTQRVATGVAECQGIVSGLRPQAENLVIGGTDPERYRAVLLSELDQATEKLEGGRPRTAATDLSQFKAKVSWLLAGRRIDRTIALVLIDQAVDGIDCARHMEGTVASR